VAAAAGCGCWLRSRVGEAGRRLPGL